MAKKEEKKKKIMENPVHRPEGPCIIVIFGASGDLTKRLLMPAIYNLFTHEALPEQYFIIGTSMDKMDTSSFRKKIGDNLNEYGTQEFDSHAYSEFSKNLFYYTSKFDEKSCYDNLKKKIDEIDKQNNCKSKLLFYLAISPAIFELVSDNLSDNGFSKMEDRNPKLILEKPFGRNLDSALKLNAALHNNWEEKQIWRIDHYLGKETVQNILAFRFGNGIFEPLWNRNYIDHVQITVAETVGVEKRGSYYDHAGALRDMIQNHLLQVVSYIAMEPPNAFNAETIRNAKIEVLNAIKIMTPEEVFQNTVRGQYGPGKIGKENKVAYRDADDVDKQSITETFVAAKLNIDNWRWSGVPFFLRTGKHLSKRYAEVVINFKKAPKQLFATSKSKEIYTNELRFLLQPKQAIELVLKAKVPGEKMTLQPVKMHFDYKEAFHTERGTGYEVLLYDCLVDDPTLFSRSDLVEQAWKIAQPMLDIWSSLPPGDFPNYASGSWGPDAANDLIQREGREWRHL